MSIKGAPKSLPGLGHFYTTGQRVEPGGSPGEKRDPVYLSEDAREITVSPPCPASGTKFYREELIIFKLIWTIYP
jgi:hypothetical protein